ncbi:hypothetical protein HII31_13456, partial [Pseudocercospora fuligena]
REALLRHTLESTTSLSTIQNDISDIRSEISKGSDMDLKLSEQQCVSAASFKQRRLGNGIAVTIIGLAMFCTISSAGLFFLACAQPRYGLHIRKSGSLTPSMAAFLTSFVAKLIELSFATIAVAFLGQALTRRALHQKSVRGATLAEMNMRVWIMQPGAVMTQWDSIRYASMSILGLFALLAVLTTILYTSAATALVQPQPSLDWQHRTLQTKVKTMFANPYYLAQNCKTPVTDAIDWNHAQITCLQMRWAASAHSSYVGFLNTWTEFTSRSGIETTLKNRPQGYAIINDNTTVTAPWMEIRNVSRPEGTNISINNVTMALPHPALLQAAADPVNKILQPRDSEGAQLSIEGSLPSPFINVVCATMPERDFAPLVYTQWPERNKTSCNETSFKNWPTCLNYPKGLYPYLNSTEQLYDVFRWGDKYGDSAYPPVFAKLPDPYNTIVNDTRGMIWGSTRMYVAGQSGEVKLGAANAYFLCSLSVGMTPKCFSRYNASSGGGTLEAICETGDRLQYNRSQPLAHDGNVTLSKDWVNVGSDWSRSVSLNAGFQTGNASIARFLTQFMVTSANLSGGLPSTAEALAVLAGNTALISAVDSPAVAFWNYTNPTIEGSYQNFNASVRMNQYASGGKNAYEKVFFIILAMVVFMSAGILAYFIWHKDWQTDFSEPSHLFALALNSPPSQKLDGSCGTGPRKEQYNINWKLRQNEGHYFIESNEADLATPKARKRKGWKEDFEMLLK